MNILPSVNYKFDNFISDSHETALINAAKELENIDDLLCKKLPRNIYKIIRKDKRTILTSLGEITFRRRYVYDTLHHAYSYPLDVKMQIPSRKRLSNEIRVRLLELACDLTYSQVGEVLAYGVKISKSTVCRCVANSSIHVDMLKPFNEHGKIHVQIDEKFVSKVGFKNKKRHYTAAIFDGLIDVGKKKKLRNRQLISDEELSGLKNRIREVLIKKFQVKSYTRVYVSGDLATYIRCFPEGMDYCIGEYVPDKYHCCRFVSDEFGLFDICNPADVVKILKETTEEDFKKAETSDFKKIYRLYQENPHIFDPWFRQNYLGCSQEGMNSHYYAPRFGRRANRFKSETINKLCHIKEAQLNNWKVELKNTDIKLYKVKFKTKCCVDYVPSYERPVAQTHTAGSFHEELDKWLNPVIIY